LPGSSCGGNAWFEPAHNISPQSVDAINWYLPAIIRLWLAL